MKSRLCEGWVQHERSHPRPHRFRYRVFMLYLDLEELPDLFDPYWLWSARRPAPAWFRKEDHQRDSRLPLDQAIRNRVEAEIGHRPMGPIRLLTHLRYFGYGMNPVSFFYCFDPDDRRVESVVAEINNTPWGEQHCYVLDFREEVGGQLSSTFAKTFHVSPFMKMNQQYQWGLGCPGQEISVHMRNLEEGAEVFQASMSLSCRQIDSAGLRRVLFRYPLMTGQVFAAIYYQAFRLWWKGFQFFPHPNTKQADVGQRVIPGGAGE